MACTVEQPFANRRAIVARLRKSARSSDHEAASRVDGKRDQTPADRYDVRLTVPDGLCLRRVYRIGLDPGRKLLPDA